MKKENYRIVVLGDSACGKTALVRRFVTGQAVTNYDPTIEDKYKKKLHFQDRQVTLEIVDTAGRELLPDMLTRYITFADAFIICYSIGSRRSFDHVHHYFENISRLRPISQIARVLVGCKCDADYREIYPEEANELSAQLQCSFAETSAFRDLNVNEVFEECVSQLNYISILRQKSRPDSKIRRHLSRQLPAITSISRPKISVDPRILHFHYQKMFAKMFSLLAVLLAVFVGSQQQVVVPTYAAAYYPSYYSPYAAYAAYPAFYGWGSNKGQAAGAAPAGPRPSLLNNNKP
ncbi:unnamed protein product [Caenorhabditis auriculariae]|uniref:Uncharacterized protein n=1 Tax=Caenorhabditis auriculariae TaxID=2777116 RepID=A0A8S1HLC0_9PELO|nr:unnamed protein product [Caenorhabditis auriculariae]